MQRLFVKEFAVQHPENLNSKAKKIRFAVPELHDARPCNLTKDVSVTVLLC